MEYTGYAFRQLAGSPIFFSFVATTAELDRWAKVPTKMASHPRGFQRAVMPTHIDEINHFFRDDPDHRNSSPTSLILGIDPSHARSVRILDASTGEIIPRSTRFQLRRFIADSRLEFAPWDSSSFEADLNGEIEALASRVELPNSADEADDELAGDDDERDGGIDPSSNGANDESVQAITPPEEEDTNGESESPSNTEPVPDTPNPEDWIARLSSSQIAAALATGEYRHWAEERRVTLRNLLCDQLKPGLIIDGQHRLRATSQNAEIPFNACLMPFADWGELAFQFIVNNGTAKKVPDALLISIVGDSLTPEDLERTEGRLNRSGIRVSLIQAVMRVQKDPNPFTGMLQFNIRGERGFLEAPAMQKKVVELWWGTRGRTGDSPRFRQLRTVDDRVWDLYDLFKNVCPGTSKREKARNWQDGLWFNYFTAFWEAVSEHFTPRLWPGSVDKWPPTDESRMTPADQERRKLMRVTVLGLLQAALLRVWADGVQMRLHMEDKSLDDFKVTPQQLKKAIAKLVRLLPEDFFTELKYTGFDASKDLRMDFVRQLMSLLRMDKQFAEIRASHRFWQDTQ